MLSEIIRSSGRLSVIINSEYNFKESSLAINFFLSAGLMVWEFPGWGISKLAASENERVTSKAFTEIDFKVPGQKYTFIQMGLTVKWL